MRTDVLSKRSASLSRGPRITIRRARGERGAAAVEFAIILPALLLLVLGVIDFGRALHQQIQLTEAAREAARVGALNGNADAMRNKVRAVVGNQASLTYVTANACNSGSVQTADATMTVRRAFSAVTPVFHIMGLFGGNPNRVITITATGVMACMG